MPSFDLRPDETLELDLKGRRVIFRALPHPGAPAYIHAMSGTEGTVYHLACEGRSEQYALKVMHLVHRTPDLAAICTQIDRLKALAGMSVCERLCLHAATAPLAIKRHPDLEFSILIPWVQGVTWSDVIQPRHTLSPQSAYAIAHVTAAVFAGLEQAGVAHCDISGPNVILDSANGTVHLVDVEHCYARGFAPPSIRVAGTAGYNLLTDYDGSWAPHADRFAAAILLSEMLCWSDPTVVGACSSSGCYFDPAEIQSPSSARAQTMVSALRRIKPALADLFVRTWQSPSRMECPAISEWATCILSLAPPQPVKTVPVQIPRTVPLSAPPPIVLPPEPSSVTALPPTLQGAPPPIPTSALNWKLADQLPSKSKAQAPVVLWESLGPIEPEADQAVIIRWDSDLWSTDDKAKS